MTGAELKVTFEETGETRRIVKWCDRCGVEQSDVFIVSPTGCAHHAGDLGRTACGVDATGGDWWWPM